VGERVRGEVAVMPRLVRSALGEDAQLVGAVRGALSRLPGELAPSAC
jgi:hypothetical protein